MKPMGENVKCISIAVIASVALISHAIAQESGDVKKGAIVADSVCAQCHAVRAGQFRSPIPMAPSFASVAATPGMTDTALRVWLRTSHPTMPNYNLTREERSHIVAYIMSLKHEHSAM
jgi:mono/diheme cytochrome c family protein